MDDSSPLFMQFKQFDADGDNKLTPDQVYQLLKLLGKNIYKGSVTSAAKLLNCNDGEAQTNPFFTFAQFKQYYESLQNPLKNDIWKGKYKILQFIKQIRDEINVNMKKQDGSTAAPGAESTPTAQDTPFRGDLQITVGPVNQNYDSFIQVSLEKVPKAESKPFIKVVFEQNSHQSAKQLQTKFKALQVNLFQLMKSSDPESSQILDYIHIITNVSDTKLNVFVTTSNEALIQLGTLAADFLDRVLNTKFSAKIQFKHEFCVDINKFIDKQANYSFYHALTKNYHTKLLWNAINVKQSLKQLCVGTDIFQDFKYDPQDPFSLFMMLLLHTETCQANLVFDNAQISQVETQSKHQILKQLADMHVKISQEEDLGLLQTISAFNNRLYAEASIGDWKAHINLHIKDVNKLFTQHKVQGENSKKKAKDIQIQQINSNNLSQKVQKKEQQNYDDNSSEGSMKKMPRKNSLKNLQYPTQKPVGQQKIQNKQQQQSSQLSAKSSESARKSSG